MKIENGLLLFILLSIMIIGTISNSGCANIIPPSGGPRDSLPPVLVSVTPRDSSRHFNTAKIVFSFNEFIDVKDVRANLIVSPIPKTDPIVDAKLRTLTVRLKDTLQPNTTYSLDFGQAVRDVNEGNILKNFTYVFTTGRYIDSARLSGKVILAATGKADSSLIVVLHRKFDDSAVIKERPRYMTRLDSSGRFLFHYLEPGAYALYALKDEGGTRRYLSKSQLFAFADSPVVVGQQSAPITLYAYLEKDTTKRAAKTTPGTVKPAAPKQSNKEKEKDRRLIFQTNIASGEFDVLDTLHFLFANPLQIFDSSKLWLTDANFTDIAPSLYHFTRDSTNKKFSLIYNWPLDTKYHLIAAKDFAQDSAGRKLLKIDTISFRTKNETQYGEVRIRIPNLDLSKNPVLQFVQNDAVKFSYVFSNQKEFRTRLFPPGEYELRILYDDNKDGVWDSGEFFGKHKQPEIVRPIPIRGIPGGKFNVKGNWDNDLDITL